PCLYLFSLLSFRPPPRPTLFPYTTLFRSRLPAASRSRRPCSPAARPSAIVFWRSSILRVKYGQMNFAENQMKSAKASACAIRVRSEEHTSELQSRSDLVCRLLLEKKKTKQ